MKWSDCIYAKLGAPVCGPGITRSGYSKADKPVKTEIVPRKRQ